jgi:hypothetical protein
MLFKPCAHNPSNVLQVQPSPPKVVLRQRKARQLHMTEPSPAVDGGRESPACHTGGLVHVPAVQSAPN